MPTIETTAIQLARLARNQIGLAEAATLFAIGSMDQPQADEIAAWLDMPKQAARGRIQSLKRKGLVAHRYAACGAVTYSLTSAGMEIITTTTKP